MLSCCGSLSAISFESNSRLTRIESSGFSSSSLESIEIPRNVHVSDGSAYLGVRLNIISIEAGHDRFVIENDPLLI
jgi:hypothetical protein